MGGSNKAEKPKKTAQEEATERRQEQELDNQIAENERRFKALARNKLGSKSLLDGTKGDQPTESAAPESYYADNPPPKKNKKKKNLHDKFHDKHGPKGIASRF